MRETERGHKSREDKTCHVVHHFFNLVSILDEGGADDNEAVFYEVDFLVG